MQKFERLDKTKNLRFESSCKTREILIFGKGQNRNLDF